MNKKIILVSLFILLSGCAVEGPGPHGFRDFCLDTTFSTLENSGEHYQQEQNRLKRK